MVHTPSETAKEHSGRRQVLGYEKTSPKRWHLSYTMMLLNILLNTSLGGRGSYFWIYNVCTIWKKLRATSSLSLDFGARLATFHIQLSHLLRYMALGVSKGLCFTSAISKWDGRWENLPHRAAVTRLKWANIWKKKLLRTLPGMY